MSITLYLEDVQLLIKSMVLADFVYIGKMDGKKERSIGIYNFKRNSPYERGIGQELSYGAKKVSFLIHWNRSPTDTEKAATALFENLSQVRDKEINGKQILFICPLVDGPVDVGTDDAGIREMVIEAEIIYERQVR